MQREPSQRVAAAASIGVALIALFMLSPPWSSESAPREGHRVSPAGAPEHVVMPSAKGHAPVALATQQPATQGRAAEPTANDIEAAAPAPDAGTTDPAESTLERASLEQIVDRFANEQPDEDATQSFHDTLAGAIADLSIDGGIEQLSCRTTVCNARLHFASLDEALRLDADGTDPGRVKWTSVVGDRPGTLLVEVYWPKD